MSFALISSVGFSPSSVVLVGVPSLFLCQAQIPRDIQIRCPGLFSSVKSGGVQAVGVAVVSK